MCVCVCLMCACVCVCVLQVSAQLRHEKDRSAVRQIARMNDILIRTVKNLKQERDDAVSKLQTLTSSSSPSGFVGAAAGAAAGAGAGGTRRHDVGTQCHTDDEVARLSRRCAELQAQRDAAVAEAEALRDDVESLELLQELSGQNMVTMAPPLRRRVRAVKASEHVGSSSSPPPPAPSSVSAGSSASPVAGAWPAPASCVASVASSEHVQRVVGDVNTALSMAAHALEGSRRSMDALQQAILASERPSPVPDDTGNDADADDDGIGSSSSSSGSSSSSEEETGTGYMASPPPPMMPAPHTPSPSFSAVDVPATFLSPPPSLPRTSAIAAASAQPPIHASM